MNDDTTPFQKEAEPAMVEVLRAHGIKAIFEHAGCLEGRPWRSASFIWKDIVHVLEIYHDTAVMMVGERLHEVYLAKEFRDDQSYISGLLARLDHYLGSGNWEHPSENRDIWQRLRRIWNRAAARGTSSEPPDSLTWFQLQCGQQAERLLESCGVHFTSEEVRGTSERYLLIKVDDLCLEIYIYEDGAGCFKDGKWSVWESPDFDDQRDLAADFIAELRRVIEEGD